MSVIKGGEGKGKQVDLNGAVHPTLRYDRRVRRRKEDEEHNTSLIFQQFPGNYL
jgi:hypothetical protein